MKPISSDYGRPPTLKVSIDLGIEKLTPPVSIASIGSCFSEELTRKLLMASFPGAVNPNGVIYNPYSMANALERVAYDKPYSLSEFFEHNGKWHSWNHHGSFSADTAEAALEKCESARTAFREACEKCDMFIATPASAVVYELTESSMIVANCHKVPNNRFNRTVLSSDECFEAMSRMISAVRNINSDCMIVLTLSPVRHYPGDLVLNARSKANLLCAIHKACELYDGVVYFPSYEIVIDELRDYRFFKEDMQHPNELAQQIVLNYFVSTFFTDEVFDLLEKAEKERRAAEHISR